MSRLRVSKNFNERALPSESIEPVSKFFFAFEGSLTEPDYFRGLERYRDQLEFNKLIELVVLDRATDDTFSHPKHILEGTIEVLDSGEHIYDSEVDEVWLVFDRDKQNVKPEQLDFVIAECKKKNYKIALSNPTFELWLLCHFDKVNLLSPEELLKNKKISNKHNFISRQLTDIIPDGYRKNKLRFFTFKDLLDTAIKNSKRFTMDIEKLKTELGTNMAVIIEALRQD